MVSKGFVGCTLGCLAGGGIEPNAAMLCLFSCYLVETRGGDEVDGVDRGDENDDAIDDEDGTVGATDDDGGDDTIGDEDRDTGDDDGLGPGAPSRGSGLQ
jgi:hypothetical protein